MPAPSKSAQAIATVNALSSDIEKVVVGGDLSPLNPQQRVEYMLHLCQRAGIDPAFRPFDYIVLNGKLTLYSNRNCAEQLRRVNGISVEITSREMKGSTFIVTAKATDKNGRVDESIGAVSCAGLDGDQLANAFMKAESKAKRRVTLSICGMGTLDETEVETIPGATRPAPKAPPKPAVMNGATDSKEKANV